MVAMVAVLWVSQSHIAGKMQTGIIAAIGSDRMMAAVGGLPDINSYKTLFGGQSLY